MKSKTSLLPDRLRSGTRDLGIFYHGCHASASLGVIRNLKCTCRLSWRAQLIPRVLLLIVPILRRARCMTVHAGTLVFSVDITVMVQQCPIQKSFVVRII